MNTGTGNYRFFVKFGFPLDIRDHSNIRSDFINHPTPTNFPEHVHHYIETEKKHGAPLGPFLTPPVNNLHVSPFICREKSDSQNRRVIVDLSWPKGEAVNDAVESDSYVGVDFFINLAKY